MKPTLLLATMSVILASPAAFGRSELSDLEKLRLRCQEQERQIHLLEEENSQLRGEMDAPAGNSPGGGLMLISTSTKTVTTNSAGSANYTVKSGDSFSSIARAKGTTAEMLAKGNGLKLDSVIRPGQVLKVPTAAAVREAAKPTPAAPAGRDLPATHKIVQGETFSSIARKYKISVTALVAANPQAKPTALRPGQIVNIPGGTPEKSTAKPSEKSAPAKSAPAPKTALAAPEKSRAETPEPVAKSDKPAPANKPAAADPIPKVHPITIDNEMTYGEFAAKYGTDTKRLNALNGLDLTTATVLAKGSELYVPAN